MSRYCPLPSVAQATPFVYGANGHSYELFTAAGPLTWEAASAAIAGGGYPATLTSAAEDAFVWGNVSGFSWGRLGKHSLGRGPSTGRQH
ncbi:MAG TPA: hypothetical protein VE422_45660 [Terriglobia bacterium]|nr:hypothetical protein [Terriglobia bacterium]